MARYYWNTSTKTWADEPYMVKEHTVTGLGPFKHWAATMVVVPITKLKNGKEETVFVPMGVRIEDFSTRKDVGPCQIPGQTYFWKQNSNHVSETGAYSYQTHKLGYYQDHLGRPSTMTSPVNKSAGVEMKAHRLSKWIAEAVCAAMASYEAYKQELRNAA